MKLGIFMRSPVAIPLALAILSTTLSASTAAKAQRCFANGDVVAFAGVASAGKSPAQWILNLSQPACIGNRDLSAVRIIGTPPPLGVPLELTGRLMLGRSSAQSTLFVALVVRSGRKVHSAGIPARAPRTAQSTQPRQTCTAPPFGGTLADYRAFVQRFSHIIKPERILAGVCNAKFGNAPRDGLHKLGLSDAKIDSESTEQLAAETVAALKNLVNALE